MRGAQLHRRKQRGPASSSQGLGFIGVFDLPQLLQKFTSGLILLEDLGVLGYP